MLFRSTGGAACGTYGGGGGGGYYGGGGGYYNGGGGGSSYATGTATGVNHTQGYANATTSGYALISYQVSAAAPTTTATEVVYPIYTLANYEDASAFSTQPTCTTAYVPTTAVAASSALRVTQCSGAVAANYSFTYVDGAVTVNRKGVVVTASNAAVTYGDAVPTITPSYTGWVNSENEAVLTTTPTCTTPYLPTTTVAAGSTTEFSSVNPVVCFANSVANSSGVQNPERSSPCAWSCFSISTSHSRSSCRPAEPEHT